MEGAEALHFCKQAFMQKVSYMALGEAKESSVESNARKAKPISLKRKQLGQDHWFTPASAARFSVA